MFDFIRKHTRLFQGILVLLIFPSFVFFGVQGYSSFNDASNAKVAEVDGRLMGLTHYLFHRHAWKIESVCYLQDLYVDPKARGLGLGRKLIEAVYARADAAGAPAVYWLTQDFNHEARQLYDRIAKVTPFIRYVRPL